MACGLTPELMAMIAQKQAEDDAGELDQALSAQQQRRVRLQKADEARAAAEAAPAGDWAQQYQAWDKFQDADEVAAEEAAEHDAALRRARGRSACDHDHSAERRIMDMSTAEKLDKCDAFKADGNRHFAEGLFGRAADKYKACRTYLEYVFPEGEAEEARTRALKLSALNNTAACALRTGELDDGLQAVYEALREDADNVKALFRRAQMLRIRDDLDGAREAIARAVELAPESRDVRREARLLRSKTEAYRERERETASRMFGSGSASSSGSGSSPRRALLAQRPEDGSAVDEVRWPVSGAADALERVLATLAGDDEADPSYLG